MPTDLTVARTIAEQIGQEAFRLMGTRYRLGDERSLTFDVRGSRKYNKITIELEPSDTYTVTFRKLGRAPQFNELAKQVCFDVYVDQLHDLIERHTELYLSFHKRTTRG